MDSSWHGKEFQNMVDQLENSYNHSKGDKSKVFNEQLDKIEKWAEKQTKHSVFEKLKAFITGGRKKMAAQDKSMKVIIDQIKKHKETEKPVSALPRASSNLNNEKELR